MEFLYAGKKRDDLQVLGKICFDTLNLTLQEKPSSDLFCGVYFEGRTRNINYIEDCAAIHSFKVFSDYNYPVFVFSPNSDKLLDGDSKYKNSRIEHIKIPVYDTHDKYSQFIIKEVWNYLPKGFEKILFLHPDGFLIKDKWETFIIDNNLDYIGAAWCHAPSIDILLLNEWANLGYPRIQCGNGGFSYRSRASCEKVSSLFSNHQLRESGREDNRPPPEDLFYSHLINGMNMGRVATIEQCMKFSLDPITLEEYNKKISFGFHCPQKNNDFQKYRDFYLTLT